LFFIVRDSESTKIKERLHEDFEIFRRSADMNITMYLVEMLVIHVHYLVAHFLSHLIAMLNLKILCNDRLVKLKNLER
jgi:hypothetical protein